MFIVKPKTLVGTTRNAAVVWNHGGGAYFSTADLYVINGQKMSTKANVVVFIPDFRNAPEAKTPKGMQDVYDCFKHAYTNAESFGVDKNKMLLEG